MEKNVSIRIHTKTMAIGAKLRKSESNSLKAIE